MTRRERLLTRILSGAADQNVRFDDLCGLLRDLGFDERIRGSHSIFTQAGIEEILNLQPRESDLAKPYQVRQVRTVLVKYKLTGGRWTMATETLKYEVIIYWSGEDNAFIAEMPELPDCAADGATLDEALANVQIIAAEWIETARELGRDIPEPRGRLLYA